MDNKMISIAAGGQCMALARNGNFVEVSEILVTRRVNTPHANQNGIELDAVTLRGARLYGGMFVDIQFVPKLIDALQTLTAPPAGAP